MKTLAEISVLLAATVSVPAVAKNAQTSFVRDGVTYTYTLTKAPKATIIEGDAAPGDHFRLIVHGNRVIGTVNGREVSFPVPEKAPTLSDEKVTSTR